MTLYKVRKSTWRRFLLIEPEEFERVTGKFAIKSNGRRDSLNTEYGSYHKSYQEAVETLAGRYMAAEAQALKDYETAKRYHAECLTWIADHPTEDTLEEAIREAPEVVISQMDSGGGSQS